MICQFNGGSQQYHNRVSTASDNGLAPGRRHAIIWTNADILSIRPQGTYFNGILFEI